MLGANTVPGTGVTPWRVAVGAGLGVSLLIGLVAAAFLWPVTTANPQHVKLAVAGPEQATVAVERQLGARNGELFDFTDVTDRNAAVEAIELREVQGAIVVGERTEILTTSAGSPQVAQLLTRMGNAMSRPQPGQRAPEVAVTDVVPGGRAGAAGTLTMLPGLIGGIAGAVVSLVLVRTPVRRFATLGTVAVVGGLIGTVVLGPWFDVLQGNYWLLAAALGMGILAIGSVIAGLGTLLGRPGMALGVLLVVLVGNPWGGLFAPREFLAEPMGTIGAYLPNGRVAELLRSINFFPDAPTSAHWLVLGLWAVVGLALLALGTALSRRASTAASPNATA